MDRKAVKKVNHRAVEALAEEVGLNFKPTGDQRKIKARFWAHVEASPFGPDVSKLGPEEIARKTKCSALSNWWKKPGFKDWFMNNNEHRERLEYLFDIALSAAEDVLLNTDPKAQSARVNMIKTISELASKMPNKQHTVVLDRDIAKMDEQQLREYIARHGTGVVDVAPAQIMEGEVSDGE